MHKSGKIELDILHKQILSLEESADHSELKNFFTILCQNHESIPQTELIKILFTLLDKVISYSKEKELIHEICEMIMENLNDINVFQYFRMILQNEQSINCFYLLINANTIENFVKILSNDKDQIILKNASLILTEFYENFMQVTNLEQFRFFLDSEHLFFRSAFLILLYKQINIELKDKPEVLNKNQLEKISSYIFTLEERLLDYHYVIRAKAVSILSLLFKERLIPKDIRNQILSSLNKRVLDKTQIVRKKAISAFSNVLLYHPFLLNGGSLKITNENSEYSNDKKEFVKQINFTLNFVKILIKEDTKAEFDEILTFLKLAYFYEIEESVLIYDILFVYIQNNFELLDKAVNNLLELFNQAPNKILNFFFEFAPSPHLQIIIQLISRKKIFKKEIFYKLFKEIKETEDALFIRKGIFFLSSSIKYLELEENEIKEVIYFISERLFRSKNHSVLINNVVLFRIMLNLILNYKNKALNKEIIQHLMKTFVKMNFFDPEITKKIIKFCFESGKEYENNIKTLLKLLNTKNTNKLKLIYAVGCIVEEEGRLIDLLENKIKKIKQEEIKGTKINNDEIRRSITTDIKERRRSITYSRLSFHGKLSDALETEKVLDKIRNKPEDEILDILFYVKEKEILYNKDALLHPYVDLIIKGCRDEDNEVVNVSFLSLLKCMSISSSFFEENINFFFYGLIHSDFRIRNNCIITIRDFFLNYNFLLEKKFHLLFNSLNDENPIVKKNAIFIIFDLLIKNIIKIKNHSLIITDLLIDKEEEIKKTALFLFNKLIKESSSLVATMFYESLLSSDKEKIKELIKIFFTFITDRIKELCFVKILRNKDYDRSIIKFYYCNASFSERFNEEMKMYEEFNNISGI